MQPPSRAGISQHDAEVSKEGGFLGVGGVAVSEAEKATLTEISNALKLSALSNAYTQQTSSRRQV
jgi:hypothetical protein